MFNPRTELATHPPHSFEKWGDLSFVPNNQKMVQNYDQSYRNDWNSHGGGVQFRLETMEEVDSGVCSPPLWGNSTPPRPQNPVQPRQNSSRKQAIAKGQSELMEMVKNMPESCYELSLKDIVEHKYQTGLGLRAADQEDFSVNSNEEKAILGANNKRFNEKNKVLRSRSKDDQNRGMLLKMGFVPFFSFNGSKKKKKGCVRNIRNNNTCSKVSPKPESSPKNVEKDWWRKRLAVSGESESGEDSSHGGSTTGSSDSSRSNSSSSSRRRNTGDRKSGCWPIFRSKKNKDAR